MAVLPYTGAAAANHRGGPFILLMIIIRKRAENATPIRKKPAVLFACRNIFFIRPLPDVPSPAQKQTTALKQPLHQTKKMTRLKCRRKNKITNGMMELSMDNMELVNGGFSPLACVLGTLFGAAKGALAGGALGLAAGPAGAVAGAFVGGIAGGAAEGYAMAFIDEKGGKKKD